MLQEYIDKIPKAFLNFQYIEETLKQYLYIFETITIYRFKGIVDYKFEESDFKKIEKMSLGKLIEIFSRRNNNNELIEKLNELAEKRNFIAHQSYLAVATESDKKDITKK